MGAAAIALTTVLLAGCAPGEEETFHDQRVDWAPCHNEEDLTLFTELGGDRDWLASLECGTLTVPLDHDDPRGRTLDLAVVRHPAEGGDDGRQGSLVINYGGPGASGVGASTELGWDQEPAHTRAGRMPGRPGHGPVRVSFRVFLRARPSGRTVVRVQLRCAFRLYPDPDQRTALARLFGCVRVVWNDAVARTAPVKAANKLLGSPKHRIAEGPYQRVPKSIELSKVLIAGAKKTTERAWLAGVSAVPLQQVLRDLDRAWKAHEDSKTGKRKGAKVGKPRFKSRRDPAQSARFTNNAGWRITDTEKLSLPGVGQVKVAWSRSLPSAPSSVTVLKDAADRYFASFVVETTDEPWPETTPEVGIDLGLSHFAVLSDGTKVANPRFLRRAEKKLRKAQSALSRKQKGSANRAKARRSLARAHVRVADARKDFSHQLSTRLMRENQAVYVEDLCVKGLGRTKLAKSVHDAGWSQLVNMLEYKAARYGRTFAKVDRFLPSSRTCSQCGALDGPKPLHVRTWTCPVCHTLHDRDLNSARIVLAAGRADRKNVCGGTIRPAA